MVQVLFSLLGTTLLLIILAASGAAGTYIPIFYLVAFFIPFLVCFNLVAFFLSVFFETPRTATALGFLYLLGGIGAAFALDLLAIPGLSVLAFRVIVVILSLPFPAVPFSLAMMVLGNAEDNGIAPFWDTGYASLNFCFIVLVLDMVFLIVVTIVSEGVSNRGLRGFFDGLGRMCERKGREGYELVQGDQQGVEVADVTYEYPGASRHAVEHLSLRFPSGQVIGFFFPFFSFLLLMILH